MVQRVATVAFEGIEVRPVDVQVQVAPAMPAFAIVGLPDKAVPEARERVRSALIASGLALPARTINLAPADLPKESSHYDLLIGSREVAERVRAGARTPGCPLCRDTFGPTPPFQVRYWKTSRGRTVAG